MWNRMRWKNFAALVLGSVIVLGGIAWPFVRAHLQAIAVLRQIGGQPVPWIVRKAAADFIGRFADVCCMSADAFMLSRRRR